MKHQIAAAAGSEEFRAEFRAIRDSFIADLHGHAKKHSVSTFRACDIDGKPFAWIWDRGQFRNIQFVGNLDDAEGFMAHMIDQGMKFAFLGSRTLEGVEVWLTTLEEPDVGPRWPAEIVHVFEGIHEGVTRG